MPDLILHHQDYLITLLLLYMAAPIPIVVVPNVKGGIWVMTATAAVLTVLSIAALVGVLSTQPLEEYQTLVAGVIALVAAWVAFWGAVSSARTQANAIQDDRKAQINHEKKESRDQRRAKSHAFLLALQSSTMTIRTLLSDHIKTASYYEQFKNYQQPIVLEMFDSMMVKIPNAYRAQWEDFLLLDNNDLVGKIYDLTSKLERIQEYVVAVAEKYRMVAGGIQVSWSEQLARPFGNAKRMLEEAAVAAEQVELEIVQLMKKKGIKPIVQGTETGKEQS